jgi:hypothetical protein
MVPQRTRSKELRLAGIVSLGLAVVALAVFFAVWWFYVMCVFGSALGALVGCGGILLNRWQQRRCGVAVAGVVANLAVLGYFLYLRITHGPIVD